MNDPFEQFEVLFHDYIQAVAALPNARGDDLIENAINAAPNYHPVHRMAARTWRCGGCGRFGLVRDVMMNMQTGGYECPTCESDRLELVEEGSA